ncbi:MAG: hypothetical protein K6A67_04060 [Bacteroidales bacterium]|nr:hypothetical protein [Bacteroidales bacterium]
MTKNKTNEKQKFKPLSQATPEELDGAFRMGALWATTELEGRTDSGAFSEAYLGVPAVEYFTMRAYQTLKSPNCKWQWKEGTKLSTLFINVMKSDMAHTLRDYLADGEPDVVLGSSLVHEESDDGYDDANHPLEVDPELWLGGYEAMSDLELLEDLEAAETRETLGYKIASAVSKGDPEMERYVELAFGLPDLRSISKRMKKTQDYVLAIETELIDKIKVTLKVKKYNL